MSMSLIFIRFSGYEDNSSKTRTRVTTGMINNNVHCESIIINEC